MFTVQTPYAFFEIDNVRSMNLKQTNAPNFFQNVRILIPSHQLTLDDCLQALFSETHPQIKFEDGSVKQNILIVCTGY